MTQTEPIIKRISLDLIKSSPYQDYVHPEEDVAEAAISIRSKGVLEKPRGYYEGFLFYLIFGHKRVEAARKAEQTYVFCEVVDKPEIVDILCQQIIEDEQHSDKPWEYRAQRYREAIEAMGIEFKVDGRRLTGITKGAEALHDITGIPQPTIALAIQNLLNKQRLSGEVEFAPILSIAPQRVIQHAVSGAGDNDQAAALAIKKSVDETITDRKAIRNIAQAIAETDDPDRIEAIMETPITNPDFAKLIKAKTEVKKTKKKKQTKKRKSAREVKEFLNAATEYRDAMKTWLGALADATVAVEFGIWSPESAQYFIEKHRTDHADLHDQIEKVEKTFLNMLSNVKLLKELQDGEVESTGN